MKRFLFVCGHNAGRSQMAEALLNARAAERGIAASAASAGTEPGDAVNPAAVAAMAEIGIDISAARPKRLTTDAVAAADGVITMGCGVDTACFAGPAEDWALPDPHGLDLAAVRPIRDAIAARVDALLDRVALEG